MKTLRSGDTRSTSLGMYALLTAGGDVVVHLRADVADGPVLIANLITLIPAAVVLQRKIASKHSSY